VAAQRLAAKSRCTRVKFREDAHIMRVRSSQALKVPIEGAWHLRRGIEGGIEGESKVPGTFDGHLRRPST
jgi:hypothetical protein